MESWIANCLTMHGRNYEMKNQFHKIRREKYDEFRFIKNLINKKYQDCWTWSGGCNGEKLYGKFYLRKRNGYAHRASYEIFIGEIPEDKVVMHKCDNKKCVNPIHLFLGTQADNVKDAVEKGIFLNKTKTACRRNHEYITGSFKIVTFFKKGKEYTARQCLKCIALRKRK